jgi:pectinesterase
MRKTIPAPLMLACFFLICLSGGNSQELSIRVSNPASFIRPLETIQVPWKEVQSGLSLSPQQEVAVFEKGEQLVSQKIDEDGDGVTDELLFQSSFQANETKQFVARVNESMQAVASVTDAKYVLPRKDIAWENDRIAHRIYGGPLAGDVSDGVDVWVKRVRYPVIDKWYDGDSLKGKKRISYHVDHGEGADFFLVGKTLGAGGCALWKDGVMRQMGFFSDYKIVATGPIRTVFSVTYNSDTASGPAFTEEKTYSLDAGMNLTRIDVRFSGIGGDKANAAIGLVKRNNTVRSAGEKEGWLSLWGPVDNDTVNGSLGIGVVFPPTSLREVREDSIHHLAIVSTSADNRISYYAGAGWTRSGDFGSAEDWNSYLSLAARALRYPLTSSLMNAGIEHR